MKHFLVKSTLLLSWAAASLTGVASANTNNDWNMQISLTSSSHLTLGEPIVLHYQINNATNQTYAAYLGWHNTEWYTLSLTDETGHSATVIPDLRLLEPPSPVGNAYYSIAPTKFQAGNTVVTRYFTLTHPGNYQLTVHVHLHYGEIASKEPSPSVWETSVKNSTSVLTKDFTFPLLVDPLSDTKLRLTAEALRQQLAKPDLGDKVETVGDSLFFMPEAQAAPTWESIVRNPGFSTTLVAEELGRLHTIKSADLLAQMLYDPKRSSDERRFIKNDLNKDYNDSDENVRTHIRQIAADHGITMPDKVNIPIATD